MKVSLNWLSDFVKVDLAPEALADRLTMAGLEVEGLHRAGSELQGIVVGEILSVRPHPQADQLRLCEVKVLSEVLPIVCGAANIAPSHHVPVARPGSVLPGGARIERTEIRGYPSAGMLCSEFELGLGEDGSGIMLLSPNTRAGQPVSSELGLEDLILDISITPNRGDCLSILGIAREVSAILGCPLRTREIRVLEGQTPVSALTSVVIEDEDLCGRYAARVIQRARVVPSPLWMRWRLKISGIRPISNIVDVTNYVMMERGQPLHAFDHEHLRGRRIVVRRARGGETLVSLDGVHRMLSPEMLVIADAEHPVAIAGVMGGADSEVTPQTQAVLLESAWFHPLSVRRTSKVLGLPSEASYRFERRVDPEGAVLAIDRAAELIGQMGGGEAAAGVFDVYPRPYVPPSVPFRIDRARRILGVDLNKGRAKAIMQSLQFSILSQGRGELKVSVPSFRGDILREIDLVEEVARMQGYDRIPRTLPRGEIRLPQSQVGPSIETSLRRLLSSCGFFEVVNFSFTRPQVLDKLRLRQDDSHHEAVRLRNPLSEEASGLRASLLPSLLENLRWNENRNLRHLKIFEVARTFHSSLSQAPPDERREAAGLAVGHRAELHWSGGKEGVDFHFLKGIVEALGRSLGVPLQFRREDLPFLHPGASAGIESGGHHLGWIGQVHPEMAELFEVSGIPFSFCFSDVDLLSSLCRPQRQYVPLPKFPAVVRDVAIMVSAQLACLEADALIRRTGGDLVDEVRLFDVFQGGNIPAGCKSLAFSIHYRAADRTLTDEEVNRAHRILLEALEKELGAKIR